MAERTTAALTFPERVSFGVVAAAFVAAIVLHLGTPLVSLLFCYLALDLLHTGRQRGKWFTVVLFVVLLLVLAYGVGHVVNRTVETLPTVADRAIPAVIQWAKTQNIELPFTDFDSLKDLAMDTVKGQVSNLRGVAHFAGGAAAQFLFFLVGVVMAAGLFLNPNMDLDRDRRLDRDNLYSACCEALSKRFETLFLSFRTVMGAQIVISAINTVLTATFVVVVALPHAVVVIGLTFLCGLFPVIGNLVSNTVIVGIAFTVSPKTALAALVFLVAIHKLEYFLNSKIVGHRIRTPLWLTLLGLIVGERLMGVPGLILAPVVLHYVKTETVRLRAPPKDSPGNPS